MAHLEKMWIPRILVGLINGLKKQFAIEHLVLLKWFLSFCAVLPPFPAILKQTISRKGLAQHSYSDLSQSQASLHINCGVRGKFCLKMLKPTLKSGAGIAVACYIFALFPPGWRPRSDGSTNSSREFHKSRSGPTRSRTPRR